MSAQTGKICVNSIDGCTEIVKESGRIMCEKCITEKKALVDQRKKREEDRINDQTLNMKKFYEESLKQNEESYNRQIIGMANDYNKKLRELETRHAEEMTNIEQKHIIELNEVEQKYKTLLESETSLLKKEIEFFEQEIEDLKREHGHRFDLEKNSLETKLQKNQEKINDLVFEKIKLEADNKRVIADLVERNQLLTNQLIDAHQSLQILQEGLEMRKESRQRAKSDNPSHIIHEETIEPSTLRRIRSFPKDTTLEKDYCPQYQQLQITVDEPKAKEPSEINVPKPEKTPTPESGSDSATKIMEEIIKEISEPMKQISDTLETNSVIPAHEEIIPDLIFTKEKMEEKTEEKEKPTVSYEKKKKNLPKEKGVPKIEEPGISRFMSSVENHIERNRKKIVKKTSLLGGKK